MLAKVWEALLWTMYLSWDRLAHMALELNLAAPTPGFWNKFQKKIEKSLRTSFEYGLPAPWRPPWQGRCRVSVRVPVLISCCVNAFFFLSLHLKMLLRSDRNNAFWDYWSMQKQQSNMCGIWGIIGPYKSSSLKCVDNIHKTMFSDIKNTILKREAKILKAI